MDWEDGFWGGLSVVGVILILGTLIYAMTDDQKTRETFIQQCNKAGGVAVVRNDGGANKCMQGTTVLYTDK